MKQTAPQRHANLSLPARASRLYRDMDYASKAYGVGWPYMLRRLRGPLRARGFKGSEALTFGLLNPRIPESTLAATITKHRLTRIQARVNPSGLVALTEHKVVFYAYCDARRLPVPRFYGLSSKPVGYSADGRPLVTADDWRTLAATLPDEFVAKPSQGVYGHGFRIFRRDGAAFVDHDGGRHRPEDLGSATMTDPTYGSFVLQDRLQDHPDLARLSGTANLQTVRLVTWVRENGEVAIPLCVLNVIAGDSVVDNYDRGRTGNLLSLVDPAKGTLEGGIGPSLVDRKFLSGSADGSDGDYFEVIKNGTQAGMPPYLGTLDKNRIWSLVSYIRSIQSKK
jgi:hypothetical protein